MEAKELISLLDSAGTYIKRKIDYHRILFSEYELPPIQEEYFVRQCEKDPEFAEAVKRNVTDIFLDYIDGRIAKCSGDPKRNSNINFIFIGEQDSGKSTYLVAIYLYYRKKHKEYWDRDVDFVWTFNTAETLEAYTSVPDFTMIIQDEEDEMSGDGSRTTVKNEGNLIKRGRFTGISLLKACPELTVIPGCDYALLPFGFLKSGKKYLEKTGDPSKCEGRLLLYSKSRFKSSGYVPLGYIKVAMGNAIKFMDSQKYFELKRKSFNKIKESGGASGVDRKKRRAEREKWAEELLEVAVKNGWDGKAKKDLGLWLDYTENIPLPLPKGEYEKLIALVQTKFEKQHKTDDSNTESNIKRNINFNEEFNVDLHKVLDILEQKSIKNWTTQKRDLAIYRVMMDHPQYTNEQLVDLEELKAKFPNNYPTDQSTFTRIRSKVGGYISEEKGAEFELWLKAQYEKDPNVKKVIRDGGQSKPDLTVIYKDNRVCYVSCKCFLFKGRSKSIPLKKFAPELLAAQKDLKKGKVAECVAEIFNLHTKKQHYHKFSPEEILKFTRKSKERITIKP
ncbi:hypothetical protein [Candidatus Harpocratesius sp.]